MYPQNQNRRLECCLDRAGCRIHRGADANFVAPFCYATLIFAALYDLLFFNEVPDVVTWIGAGTIIAGAVLLALREARHHARPRRRR